MRGKAFELLLERFACCCYLSFWILVVNVCH
mgnify:CR=1 FL=1